MADKSEQAPSSASGSTTSKESGHDDGTDRIDNYEEIETKIHPLLVPQVTTS